VVVIFLIAGILAIYSLEVLTDTKETMCDGSYDNWDSTNEGCYTCNSTFANYNTSDNQCYNATTGDLSSTAPTIGSKISYNATGDAIDGVAKVPDKMPTLGNVVIAAIIIGVLMAAFGGFVALENR